MYTEILIFRKRSSTINWRRLEEGKMHKKKQTKKKLVSVSKQFLDSRDR